MTNLDRLHNQYQQSPWLDNLSRDLVTSGKLQNYISQGIRGLTSNPTILENAIKSSDLYDEQIRALAADGLSNEDIFFKITIDDIRSAAQAFQPIWHDSQGEDGYVSLEVSPLLADDTEKTIAQARQLWQEVAVPNLLIKVPATPAGIPAIQQLLSEGINVNVTLIFSLERYRQVVEAFLAAHRTEAGASARSVASFFVSRVDTEVDKRLEAIDNALALRGQAAVAQAQIAYDIFLDNFARSAVLDGHGSSVQRLLWASTSTKNPGYDDLLYVSNLLAPLTVNTLPEDTIAKIIDHLPPEAPSLSIASIDQAATTWQAIQDIGIDLDDVAHVLETEGVQKFKASFESLLETIESKK